MNAHSIWSASGAERWFNCPGSIRAIGELDAGEGAPSIYAQEGTAMHTVAQRALDAGLPALDFVNDEVSGVWMDEDHAEAVQVYLDTIMNDWLDQGGDLLVEHRFDLGNLWPGLFGTNDACLVGNRLLRVYDLKGGKGVPVEVKDNKQLLIYAVGAWRTLQTKYEFDQVEIVIVQPRCPHRQGPVRRWRIDVVDLLDFTTDLHTALSATVDPDAPLVAGDWCLFCPARARCPALKAFAMRTAQMDFGEAPKMPTLMSHDEVAAMLGKVDLLDEYVRSVRLHALALAEGGHTIPGWKLVPKRAVRKWRDEDSVPAFMKARGYSDADIYTEPKLKSPAQMEKLLPRGERAEVIGGLVEKVSSGNNLVPEVDSRGASRASVHDDFS